DVDYLFGGHIGLKLGRLGVIAASGHGFLASTKFDVTFQGKAAHAGVSPEEGHNALAAASTAVLNLLAIPRHGAGSSRINIGTLHAGTGSIVVPERAVMEIETRGGTGAINEYMEAHAQRICRAAAEMYECEYESRFMGAAGSAVCSPELARFVMKSAAELSGVTEVLEDIDFGGGEDITYMINDVQAHGGMATEMMLGTEISAPHHNGRFDFD
ncbi:MAG: peptidase dimerization domain-containing protein, partial [Oscillospiraceae bacterium]